jgi:hypothetical protein
MTSSIGMKPRKGFKFARTKVRAKKANNTEDWTQDHQYGSPPASSLHNMGTRELASNIAAQASHIKVAGEVKEF